MKSSLKQTNYFTLTAFLVCALTVLLPFATSHAQSSKPKLVPIVINEQTTDKKAVAIVEKFYNDWIQSTNFDGELGAVQAKFIPINKDGTDNQFIYGVLYDEPLGGCFVRGCRTIILHKSPNSNEWIGVFNAFIYNTWYDETSKKQRAANLIFSSDASNSKVGVWMWNGTGYQLVNNR